MSYKLKADGLSRNDAIKQVGYAFEKEYSSDTHEIRGISVSKEDSGIFKAIADVGELSDIE